MITDLQIMEYIIAIANPRKGLALQVTKVVLKCHQVRQSLKRMVKIAQGIDDGYSGMFAQLQYVIMSENTSKNQ